MYEINCWNNRTFPFDINSTALLVIDMQRDFLASDGYIATKYPEVTALQAIVPAVKKVLQAARKSGLTIFHTREGYQGDRSDVNAYKRALGYVGQPGPNGPFLIRGTYGHDFYDGFEPLEGEKVIDKPGFSAFYKTNLDNILKNLGITHLIICGITTQCCVHSTLRDAVDRGYFCLSLADCCAAEDTAVHDATMQIIQAENHLFGWISSSSQFLGKTRNLGGSSTLDR